MTEPGDKLAHAYRGLAREEPPPALDAAILAAARESVRPRARNRWAGPVSIAAVLVLGLGVSLRMQTEQPGIETSEPPPSSSSAEYPMASSADTAAPEALAKDARPLQDRSSSLEPQARLQARAPAPAPGPKLSRAIPADPTPAPESRARAEDSPPPEALAKKRLDERDAESPPQPKAFAEAPAAAAPARAAPPASAASPAPAALPAPAAIARMSPPPPMVAQSAAPVPAEAAAASSAPLRAKREAAAGAFAQDSAKKDADERVTELERIARLRRDGRDAEADKALEEFRRRHPDYRIPEAVWERVRPR